MQVEFPLFLVPSECGDECRVAYRNLFASCTCRDGCRYVLSYPNKPLSKIKSSSRKQSSPPSIARKRAVCFVSRKVRLTYHPQTISPALPTRSQSMQGQRSLSRRVLVIATSLEACKASRRCEAGNVACPETNATNHPS